MEEMHWDHVARDQQMREGGKTVVSVNRDQYDCNVLGKMTQRESITADWSI